MKTTETTKTVTASRVRGEALQRSVVEARVADSDLQDEWALRQALAKVERRSDAKQLFFSWPNLEPITLRLAHYATNLFPANRFGYPTLLEVVLERAFGAYEAVCKRDPGDEQGPMHAFLDELFISASPSLIDYQLSAEVASGTIVWPAMSEPIARWIKRHRIKSVEFRLVESTASSRVAASDMLVREILSQGDRDRVMEWSGKACIGDLCSSPSTACRLRDGTSCSAHVARKQIEP